MLATANRALPFPRGNTNGDAQLTLDDSAFSELEGKIFEVPDTQHGTGANTLLMAVKNDTGSAITVARKFCEFSIATALDWGRRIGTFPCNTDSAVALPLDDAYVVGNTIPDDDIFYVILRGWCTVGTAGTGNLVAGMNVASSSAGLIRDLAAVAAGGFVIGTLAYAASYPVSTSAVVWVDPPSLALPPGAG